MKSKKLLLLGLVFVLVVLALSTAASAALGDMVKGNGTKIIVNVVVIGAAFYLTLPLLGKKAETPQGNNAMIFIAIILAIVLALNVVPRGQFIWETNLLKGFFDVLKNPTRLGILVGATAVFLWLFTSLEIGGGAEKGFANKLNFVLALVIGYHLASRDPISVAMVVRAGELIGLLVIYRNLEKSVGDNKVLAAGLAAFIVFWISAITFPDYALLGEKNLWKMGLSLVSIAVQVVIVIVAIMIGKGKSPMVKWGLGIGVFLLVGGVHFIPGLKEYGLFSGLKSIFFILALVGIGAATMVGGKADAKHQKAKDWAKYVVGNRLTDLLFYYVPRIAHKLGLKNVLREEGQAELNINMKPDVMAAKSMADRLRAAMTHRDVLQVAGEKLGTLYKGLGVKKDKEMLLRELDAYEYGGIFKGQTIKGWKKLDDEIAVTNGQIENLKRKKTIETDRVRATNPEMVPAEEAKWENQITNLNGQIQRLESDRKSKFDTWNQFQTVLTQHDEIEEVYIRTPDDDKPHGQRYEHTYYVTDIFRQTTLKGPWKSMEVNMEGYVLWDLWREQNKIYIQNLKDYIKYKLDKIFNKEGDPIKRKMWLPQAEANLWLTKVGEKEEEEEKETEEKTSFSATDEVEITVTLTRANVEAMLNVGKKEDKEEGKLNAGLRDNMAKLLLLIPNSHLEIKNGVRIGGSELTFWPQKLFESKDAKKVNDKEVPELKQWRERLEKAKDSFIAAKREEDDLHIDEAELETIKTKIYNDMKRESKEAEINEDELKRKAEEQYTINKRQEIVKKLGGKLNKKEYKGEQRPSVKFRHEMEKCYDEIEKIIKAKKDNKTWVRWVPPIEIVDGGRFKWFYYIPRHLIIQDMWQTYIKIVDDRKDGRYRGFGRRADEYISAYYRFRQSIFNNDRQIAFTRKPSSFVHAYDRRAIDGNLTSEWKFYGRKAYWDEDTGDEGWSSDNCDPAIALYAWEKFLSESLKETVTPKEKAKAIIEAEKKAVEDIVGKSFSFLRGESAGGNR